MQMVTYLFIQVILLVNIRIHFYFHFTTSTAEDQMEILTSSCIMLLNDQIYLENLFKVCLAILQHYA